MLYVELPINIFLFAFALMGAGFLGYSLRSRQLKKKQFKIFELRKEMVDNHAQILELQKENVQLEMKFQNRTPVREMRQSQHGQERQDLEILDSAI